MKYNQLPHVLEHNKRQAKKHEGETLASLRVKIAALEEEAAALEAENNNLKAVLASCIYKGNFWHASDCAASNNEPCDCWVSAAHKLLEGGENG